jgi:methylated-DNA-[protein]-cysteine S-methyltransferase
LDEYFEGTRRDFDLTLELRGTDFQVAVWSALRAIPYGQTTSYSAIANAIGKPASVRAVGAANGRNPISIVVPCHRVIGADGSLTGYGWGVDRKAWLLDHEQDHPATLFRPEAWSSPR